MCLSNVGGSWSTQWDHHCAFVIASRLFVSQWPRATKVDVYSGTFCHCWFGQQMQKWSIIWGRGVFKALRSAAALLMAIDPDTKVSYGGFNYSKYAVCVLLRWSEWKLCAAFPSRGGPGPPSKQTPTWCGAKWGGTRSTVSPHSECFVLDEAPIVVLGSQPHVTCLGMRKAPASWVLSAWGGPADQDTNITSGNKRVGEKRYYVKFYKPLSFQQTPKRFSFF